MHLYYFPKEILKFNYSQTEELIENKEVVETKDGKVIVYKHSKKDIVKYIIKFQLDERKFNILQSFYNLVKLENPFIFYNKIVKFATPLTIRRSESYHTQVTGEITLVEQIPLIFNLNNFKYKFNSDISIPEKGIYNSDLINFNYNEASFQEEKLYQKYVEENIPDTDYNIMIPLFYILQTQDEDGNYIPAYSLKNFSSIDFIEIRGIDFNLLFEVEEFGEYNLDSTTYLSNRGLADLITNPENYISFIYLLSGNGDYKRTQRFKNKFLRKLFGQPIIFLYPNDGQNLNTIQYNQDSPFQILESIKNTNTVFINPRYSYLTSIFDVKPL